MNDHSIAIICFLFHILQTWFIGTLIPGKLKLRNALWRTFLYERLKKKNEIFFKFVKIQNRHSWNCENDIFCPWNRGNEKNRSWNRELTPPWGVSLTCSNISYFFHMCYGGYDKIMSVRLHLNILFLVFLMTLRPAITPVQKSPRIFIIPSENPRIFIFSSEIPRIFIFSSEIPRIVPPIPPHTANAYSERNDHMIKQVALKCQRSTATTLYMWETRYALHPWY